MPTNQPKYSNSACRVISRVRWCGKVGLETHRRNQSLARLAGLERAHKSMMSEGAESGLGTASTAATDDSAKLSKRTMAMHVGYVGTGYKGRYNPSLYW